MSRPVARLGAALLLLQASSLMAQTYVAAGDASLTLTQVLFDHPEGMVITLPSASGRSLEGAFATRLGQEPALELQVGTLEADRRLPLGRELAALRGWDAELPHWALLGPDRQVYAEGTEVPTAAQFAERYRRSPLRSRAERLRVFLRTHPGHLEALAQLVLEVRSLGERRAEQALALLQAPAAPAASVPKPAEGSKPTPGEPSGEESAPPQVKPAEAAQPPPVGTPATAAPAAPPTLLPEAEDDRIWGDYAQLYQRFMAARAWPGIPPSDSGPLAQAAELTSFAGQSPRLRDVARSLMPEVERRLQDRPSDERRWRVWLSLREAGAGGRPGALLAGLAPPPGTRHWPPAAALDAFVEDAQSRDDWRDAEPVLQAAYDRTQDLLQALDAAAREDAHGGSTPRLGTYFGFGMWNGESALLAEAKLRLGKAEEADHIFREAFARAPRPDIAREAAALARRCGAGQLAEAWEHLGNVH